MHLDLESIFKESANLRPRLERTQTGETTKTISLEDLDDILGRDTPKQVIRPKNTDETDPAFPTRNKLPGHLPWSAKKMVQGNGYGPPLGPDYAGTEAGR